MLVDTGVHRLPDQRQKLMSDPIPHKTTVNIRFIFDPADILFSEESPQLGTGKFKKRPGERWAKGRNAAQPPDARSAEEVEEHGLSLVVGLVRQENPAGSALKPNRIQIGMAQPSGRLLQALSLSFSSRHLNMAHLDTTAEVPGNPADEIGVLKRGTASNAVFHMGHDNFAWPESLQHDKQRHRISAA
ncbi:MAG: hypothetical protein PHF19_00600 [Synergistales bacterium]|nr:hypothetical protein [Synergistales bacterium]